MIPARLPSSQRPCGSRAVQRLPLETDMKQYATSYTDDDGEHRSTPVPYPKALDWARLMRENGHPEAVVVCREHGADYWRQVWPNP